MLLMVSVCLACVSANWLSWHGRHLTVAGRRNGTTASRHPMSVFVSFCALLSARYADGALALCGFLTDGCGDPTLQPPAAKALGSWSFISCFIAFKCIKSVTIFCIIKPHRPFRTRAVGLSQILIKYTKGTVPLCTRRK